MTKRFLALDACRGLCAVAVMLFHLDALTHWYWWPAVRNSYVAVDFFFVLSGFVIASAYRNRLGTLVEGARFALRRFGRLYPLHLSVLAVYVAVEAGRLLFFHTNDAFTESTSLSALWEQLVLVQGFTPAHETWNYPAWSISVELWTNFALALLALWSGRWLRSCSLLILLATGTYIAGGVAIAVPAEEAPALLDAMRSIFEFFLGLMVFELYSLARRRGWIPPPLGELLVIPLVVWAFGYADSVPSLGLPFVFAAVVLLFAFEAGPLSALLRRPAFVRLGTLSYSIYLTHSLYLLALEALVFALAQHLGLSASIEIGGDDVLALGGRWAMDGAALACVASALLGSALTYRYIEEPARLFFNRLSLNAPALAKAVATN
ncbi:MAG TPA: acyltransferase [Rhizomicrobium sp.]|jgi:hypothetical protein